MSLFRPASKTQLRARLAFTGPSGSGKTWTALEFSHVLGDRIAVVDTEHGSASLYSDEFKFDVLDWPPPYDPRELAKTVKAAEGEGFDVLVIDSLSHFWEGEGGTQDIADSAGQRSGGNKFAGWKIATPALRNLIDTMLGADLHVVVTMRSKMEYALEQDERGRAVPKRIGMAPVMRQGVEYEFTAVADLDLEHRMVFTKSRCRALADAIVQPGRAPEAAETFLKWLNAGEPSASRDDVAKILALFDTFDDVEYRKSRKQEFLQQFGRPDQLTAAQMPAALAFFEQEPFEVVEVSPEVAAEIAANADQHPIDDEPKPAVAGPTPPRQRT